MSDNYQSIEKMTTQELRDESNILMENHYAKDHELDRVNTCHAEIERRANDYNRLKSIETIASELFGDSPLTIVPTIDSETDNPKCYHCETILNGMGFVCTNPECIAVKLRKLLKESE